MKTMSLSSQDVDMFYKLLHPLHYFANQQLQVIKGVTSLHQFEELTMENRFLVREALLKHLNLISTFVKKNPFGLASNELDIVQCWTRGVKDSFMVMEYTKEHTIFTSNSDTTKVYGVMSLHSRFSSMFGSRLPVLVETMLLPFRNHIVYDGIIKKGDFEKSARGELYRKLMLSTYTMLRDSNRVIQSF